MKDWPEDFFDDETDDVAGRMSEAEAWTRSVLDTAADSIVAFDASGRIELFNKAAERMFGYAVGEAVGKNVRAVVPALWERTGVARSGGSGDVSARDSYVGVTEATAQRRDGSAFPIELSVSEAGIQGKTIFTGIVRDISDRRKTEESLRLAATEAAHLVLQRNERRLRLFKNVVEQSGSAESVEEVLRCGLTSICQFAGWPVGHAWIMVADGTALVSRTVVPRRRGKVRGFEGRLCRDPLHWRRCRPGRTCDREPPAGVDRRHRARASGASA